MSARRGRSKKAYCLPAKDLDKLKKWDCVTLMRFSKAKCRVLHLGQGTHWYQYKLGMKGWRAALPRRTWGTGG